MDCTSHTHTFTFTHIHTHHIHTKHPHRRDNKQNACTLIHRVVAFTILPSGCTSHTHTRTHTHTNTHQKQHTHTKNNTHARAHTHTHIHTYTHTHQNQHAHTQQQQQTNRHHVPSTARFQMTWHQCASILHTAGAVKDPRMSHTHTHTHHIHTMHTYRRDNKQNTCTLIQRDDPQQRPAIPCVQ